MGEFFLVGNFPGRFFPDTQKNIVLIAKVAEIVPCD